MRSGGCAGWGGTVIGLLTSVSGILARRVEGSSVWGVLALGGVAVMAACGWGGTGPSTGVERRALSADFLERQAVNY